MDERWMIVNKKREPVIVGSYSKEYLERLAKALTEEGDYGPYHVVRDVVAESCE